MQPTAMMSESTETNAVVTCVLIDGPSDPHPPQPCKHQIPLTARAHAFQKKKKGKKAGKKKKKKERDLTADRSVEWRLGAILMKY